jgi:hypothetical protein
LCGDFEASVRGDPLGFGTNLLPGDILDVVCGGRDLFGVCVCSMLLSRMLFLRLMMGWAVVVLLMIREVDC